MHRTTTQQTAIGACSDKPENHVCKNDRNLEYFPRRPHGPHDTPVQYVQNESHQTSCQNRFVSSKF